MQSHRPIPSRHRSHLFGKLETFSTITLHGAGCFVSKAMARICISAKSIFSPVVEKMLMVAGASPALVSSLLIHGDQSVPFDVWLSVCQFHTRRAVVNSAFCCATQLPFQFATLRFAARSPSSQRAGDDPAASSEVGTVHIDPVGVLAALSEVAQLRPIYFVSLDTECASVFRY